MYEKIITGLVITVCGLIAFIFYNFGRRKRTSTDNARVGELEQRTEDDIRGAGADNRAASEQNKELRDNNQRAAELIKRAKEILHMDSNS